MQASLCRFSGAICVAAIMLTGCGGAQMFTGSAAALSQHNMNVQNVSATEQSPKAGGYQTIYSFENTPDGSNPQMALTAIGGKLYGTTVQGGTYGKGSVFVVSPSGKERVLYSFKGPPDGIAPYAGLVELHGKLYGTTQYGGTAGEGPNSGTVFELTMAGKERVLHSFTGPPDGGGPAAPLIVVDGDLYGTTKEGGMSSCIATTSGPVGCGTIFRVSTSGHERVLYRFKGAPGDGALPVAPMLADRGGFYGTTSDGGSQNDGTVYEFSKSGRERVIHGFTGEPDGNYPVAGLTAVGDAIYGTTALGGSGSFGGDGTLFELIQNRSKLRVLYSFHSSAGIGPTTAVVSYRGALYGTAIGPKDGTVYEIDRNGKHSRLLHAFQGSPDGDYPVGGLVRLQSSLYGTTAQGGNCGYQSGCGTVYEVTPK